MRALQVTHDIVGRVVGRSDQHEQPRLLRGGEPLACGLAGGRWQVAGGKWQVARASGKWQVASGKWQTAGWLGGWADGRRGGGQLTCTAWEPEMVTEVSSMSRFSSTMASTPAPRWGQAQARAYSSRVDWSC